MAITNTKPPTSVKVLQVFLEMVNYLNKYSPRLGEISSYLRDPARQNTRYIYDPDHQEAFVVVKNEITQVERACFYDLSKPLTL